MSPYAHFIMMDFILHRFHIYYGDVNDPSSWKYNGESFSTCAEAENRTIELDHIEEP